MKISRYRLLFVWLTSVIFLAAYFIFVSTGNVFQNYAFEHHLDRHIFPYMNIVAMRISTVLIALCLLNTLQSIEYQRYFILALLFFLGVGLLVPLSLTSYSIVSGLSQVIFSLTEPWRQLYAPPALRATIEGITEGLTGVFDLTGMSIERRWSHHLALFHYVAPIVITLMIVFWQLTRKLKYVTISKITQTPQSLSDLFTKHPYIFIACLFGGINESIFSYTFILGKEALPHFSPQYYQCALYAGSIIGPILMGRLADKRGIFLICLISGISLTVIKMLTAFFSLPFNAIFQPYPHYILAFIEGGLSASIWVLSVAFVGERLRTRGIFRAFAMSNIFFGLGCLIGGRFYEYFSFSFMQTELSIGMLNIILMILFWFFFKHEQKTACVL